MRPLRLPGLSPIRLVPLLLLVCAAAGAFTGCALVMPGCDPGDSLPQKAETFLHLALAADDRASTVTIDRTGRTQFIPGHTTSSLSLWRNPAFCRTISDRDLFILEQEWSKLSGSSGDPWAQRPEQPLLMVEHLADGEQTIFFIKSTKAGERPALETAAAVTLSVVGRTYGNRFLRELRAAGLQDLFHEPG